MVDDTVFQAQSEQAINKILKTQQLLLHKLVPNSTKLMLTHSSNSRGHIWFVVIKPTICLNADISFDFCATLLFQVTTISLLEPYSASSWASLSIYAYAHMFCSPEHSQRDAV